MFIFESGERNAFAFYFHLFSRNFPLTVGSEVDLAAKREKSRKIDLDNKEWGKCLA